MPGVLARGEVPQGAEEGDHATVRAGQEGERRWRFRPARTSAGAVPDGGAAGPPERRAARAPRRRAERAFTALTMTPALLVMAWLVPGTALLVAGRLLALPMVIIFVPLALALCYFAMRRLPVRWSRFGAVTPAA